MVAIERGLAVFALPPGGRRPQPGWQQRTTSDPAVIRREWVPGDNVGIGCRASGIVGIDLDRHADGRDGVAAFTALCARWGQPWPDTLTIATPHGLHLYLRVPAGVTIGSISGGRAAFGAGIDTRGPGRRTGGYLIGPSSTVAGARYVIQHDTTIAELPAWLADLLHEPAVTSERG
jgi:hypothetical protein